jgi:very-short-patch-repair endonuclease
MAKKNDMIKSWLAKKEGYELIRIKEQQLKEEYNTVVENISLVTNKEGEQNEQKNEDG